MNRFTYKDILNDWAIGLKQWRVWTTLSWYFLKMDYRMTSFGPHWIIFQQSIFLGSIGYIFAHMQKENFASFFVYFTVGYTFWVLITGLITMGGRTFSNINHLPNLTSVSISNHAYLRVHSQLLLFAFQIIPAIIILSIYYRYTSINFIMLLFGLSMLIIFGFWVSIFLGCLCLRFPDLNEAIGSIMQVMFFITPVMYDISNIPYGEIIANINPFYHLLIVIRGNIINENVTYINYLTVLSINLIGILLTLFTLKISRAKLPYWAV